MTLGRFAGQVPGQQMPAGARLVYLSVLSVLPEPVLVLPIFGGNPAKDKPHWLPLCWVACGGVLWCPLMVPPPASLIGIAVFSTAFTTVPIRTMTVGLSRVW
jgi:hypothetical protein